MNAHLSDPDLTAEVARWVTETRCLLATCARLIEYFGDEEEFSSFEYAISLPRELIDYIAITIVGRRADLELPSGEMQQFHCKEPVATILSPILQVISEPIPEFVPLARQTLLPPDRDQLIRGFGMFSGIFGRYVCGPLWDQYPRLAPEGWPLGIEEKE